MTDEETLKEYIGKKVLIRLGNEYKIGTGYEESRGHETMTGIINSVLDHWIRITIKKKLRAGNGLYKSTDVIRLINIDKVVYIEPC